MEIKYLNRNTNLQKIVYLLAAIAILTSSLHFWPFPDIKLYQLLCPSNLMAFLFLPILFAIMIKNPKTFPKLLPHTSILAFLLISILSLATSCNPARSVIFTSKLIITFIAAYTLFVLAMNRNVNTENLIKLATIALTFTIISCLFSKYFLKNNNFHTFQNAYKYGTYIACLTPLCAGTLLLKKGFWARTSGFCLVIASLLSAGSMGAYNAVSIAMIFMIILTKDNKTRYITAVALVIAFACFYFDSTSTLKNDFKLTENNSANIKQRYLEYQAQINILEDFPLTGTGPGCINTYRSSYYYRLPKLNTLQPFDQNGYLATAAESGLIALVCLCWIFTHHAKLAYTSIKTNSDIALPIFTAIIAAAVANIFSSVLYNGILLVFVFILALTKTSSIQNKDALNV